MRKTNKPETAGSDTPFIKIEELKNIRVTPEAVFCGVCAARGWKSGRQVTETEYDAAVIEFSGGSIGIRKTEAAAAENRGEAGDSEEKEENQLNA